MKKQWTAVHRQSKASKDIDLVTMAVIVNKTRCISEDVYQNVYQRTNHWLIEYDNLLQTAIPMDDGVTNTAQVCQIASYICFRVACQPPPHGMVPK